MTTYDEQRADIRTLVRALERCHDDEQRVRLLNETMTNREQNAYEAGRLRDSECSACKAHADRRRAERERAAARARFQVIDTTPRTPQTAAAAGLMVVAEPVRERDVVVDQLGRTDRCPAWCDDDHTGQGPGDGSNIHSSERMAHDAVWVTYDDGSQTNPSSLAAEVDLGCYAGADDTNRMTAADLRTLAADLGAVAEWMDAQAAVLGL